MAADAAKHCRFCWSSAWKLTSTRTSSLTSRDHLIPIGGVLASDPVGNNTSGRHLMTPRILPRAAPRARPNGPERAGTTASPTPSTPARADRGSRALGSRWSAIATEPCRFGVLGRVRPGFDPTGRPATAPGHAAPTSDSSHTSIQPQTTTDAIVTRTTISTSARSGEVAREVRRHVHVRGHSVETELVALDVLHHEARLVVGIGRQ